MAYNITKSNGNAIEIADGSIDSSTLSINLVGLNVQGYGEAIAENFVHLLENFAHNVAPISPTAGQLWYDSTGVGTLKIYNGSTWAAVASNSGAITFDDDVTINGVLTLAFNAGTSLITHGDIMPNANCSGGNGPDIGSPSLNFCNIYGINMHTTTVNTTTINLGGDINPLVNCSGGVGSDLGTNILQFCNAWVNQYHVKTDVTPNTDNTAKVGTASLKFLEMHATTFYGTATAAQYADLAERFEADAVYAPGTVVSIGGEREITLSQTAGDTSVFGVISTAPAYMMNSEAGDDETHPYVALMGRVPVNVIGKVSKGDRLVSAGAGFAKRMYDGSPITVIIGRALEDKVTEDVGQILAVVGVK